MNASAAGRAFGSDLRLRLIRHYLDHPGSQAAAARALDVSSANITRNTAVLIETGVVTVGIDAEDHRTRVYRVDQHRLDQLTAALADYFQA